MRATSSIHWNAYPTLLVSALVAAGMCAAHWLQIPGWICAAVCCAGILGAAAAFQGEALSRMGSGVALLFVGVAVFGAGALRFAAIAEPPRSDLSMLPVGSEVRIVGRPAAISPTSSGIRFALLADSVLKDGHVIPFGGRVQVYVRGGTVDEVTPCRMVSVEGRLAELPEARNPGEFDYAAFLRGRGIFVRLFAEGLSGPAATDSTSIELSGAACLAHRLKATIDAYFQRSIPDDAARGIVRALVVGDRSAIDGETEARFRRTGLLHLLAVSGLHVLIVGMILYQLLRPIFLRMGMSWTTAEYARTTATSFVLIVYALVTGLPASVVRAVIMAMLFMISTTFQRSAHSLNTLGVAVLILLLVRPAQLFEPGFQLSVAAVAAIITLQDRFSTMLGTAGEGSSFINFIRSSTTVSLAASAGTLPVLLFHFGSVSFAGLFLNTVAVPLTSATLASSVTTAAATSISGLLGATFGYTSQFLARSLLFVVEQGEPYFRWAYLEASVGDAPVIVAIVVFLVMVAQWPRPRIRWRLCAAVLSLLILDLAWDAAQGELRSSIEIVFLDVGQGDGALVKFPNGKTLLVDAGPRTAFVDAGRYVVLPYLQRRQIRKLDAVLITHPDSDHLGGFPALARNVSIDRVLHSGRPHESELYTESMHILDSLNIAYQALRAGDTLALDPSVRVQTLHPVHPDLASDPNASSVVLLVRFGSTNILLMGDAEREAEHDIVRRYGDLAAAEAIKVGHHGSSTSSTALFLSRVVRSNTIAIVSAGSRNRFGHPDSTVVRRLRSFGLDVWRTDRNGAIRLRSDGRTVVVLPWR